MEENKKDVLPLEGEPLTAPQISEPVVNALAAALSKIETYVPTQYINDGPPDIDADHLNHAEQAIMRVTNLANGAADAIAALQSQVTQLNNNLGNTVKYLRTDNIDNAAETLWPKIEESSSYDFTWIPETGEGVTKGAQARVIGFYNNSNYESQMILSYLTSAPVVQREKINGSWGNWKVFATKSDLGDLITHRKTTGNTSDSGNITINRPEGYSLIGAYINSVYVRLSIPTVYQKTIIVRCFDENMSPLKNTLVEVISLWIKKDISY